MVFRNRVRVIVSSGGTGNITVSADPRYNDLSVFAEGDEYKLTVVDTDTGNYQIDVRSLVAGETDQAEIVETLENRINGVRRVGAVANANRWDIPQNAIAFVDATESDLQFLRQATKTEIGYLRFATDTEISAGTIENVGVDPAGLRAEISRLGVNAVDLVSGGTHQAVAGSTIPILLGGRELFPDPNIESADGWTFENGWSISGGNLVANNATGRAFRSLPDGTLSSNVSYILSYEIANLTSGSLRTFIYPDVIGGGSASTLERFSSGSFEETVTVSSSGGSFANTVLFFTLNDPVNLEVTRFSIRETGEITILAPANPQEGDMFTIVDFGRNTEQNNITVQDFGQAGLRGVPNDNFVISTSGLRFTFRFIDGTWEVSFG